MNKRQVASCPNEARINDPRGPVWLQQAEANRPGTGSLAMLSSFLAPAGRFDHGSSCIFNCARAMNDLCFTAAPRPSLEPDPSFPRPPAIFSRFRRITAPFVCFPASGLFTVVLYIHSRPAETGYVGTEVSWESEVARWGGVRLSW